MDYSPSELKSIYIAALDHEPGEPREKFLLEACGANTALRQRVESLLAARERADDLLGADAPSESEMVSVNPDGIPPERIERYRIERLLGQGGFGLVYLAFDEQLNRRVAIKLPHRQLVARVDAAEAYLTEARAVAGLNHPHIVPVYDVGSTDEFPCYIVSKYIDGIDLATRLKQSRLSILESVDFVATVAEALHHAHQQGLVHRDIKPGNLLLDHDGIPFLADFGVALREENVGTGPRYAGTPAYMSPEQARGEGHRVDGRSDLFSLGVVFYELLVGKRPFFGKSTYELMEHITTFEPRPPRQYDERIPKELDRICLKALSKRASERYSTAKDMADELRQFLKEEEGGVWRVAGEERDARSQRTPHTAPLPSLTTPHPSLATNFSPTTPHPTPTTLKIVPKGLRSFDAHDADFFLELLPGPRDRDGFPESIRFWKTRIEETEADNTFTVGLIYGPSGCGKSSLVKAGLLPRLTNHVITVYLEATAEETELRLLNALRKRCPGLPDDLSLKETLAALRQGLGIPPGKKVLIVLDQFEQWLHATKEDEHTELVESLRQCDGGRVQCIVMVRDDFWMAATRFMRELEVRLLEAQNSAAVDLFPIRHAERVLGAFGQAFGAFPNGSAGESKEVKEFLKHAVSGLAQEGKVNCVRLALFAEMMKGKAWTKAVLKEVGGTEGIGEAFLEETFSLTTALPHRRKHQIAVRGVIKMLLPSLGVDIKGHMRSYSELLEASGYGNNPKDFDELLHILDSEIRLITSTDPQGVERETSPLLISSPATHHTPHSTRFYQLAHDYLVPSARDWLTRKQKETWRGRTELSLADRASIWQARPETRHLPSLWESLMALWFIPRRNQSEVQRSMLRQARRVHVARYGSGFAVAFAIAFMVWTEVSRKIVASREREVRTAMIAVENTLGTAVPVNLRDLKRLPQEMVVAYLKQRFKAESSTQSLGLAYAMAGYGDPDVAYLCSQITNAAAGEVDNLVDALSLKLDAALETIRELAKHAEADASVNPASAESDWRVKARMAIISLHLNDDRLASDMCRIQERPDPIQRTIFIDEFTAWHGTVANLAETCKTMKDVGTRSGICLAVGGIQGITPAEKERWTSVLTDWYETARDGVTHNSAGWALRKWGIAEPMLTATAWPSEERDWFVNSSLGLTMLKIAPGIFVRRQVEQARIFEGTEHDVAMTKGFFLSDREITNGQFRQFMNDPHCPPEDKPSVWMVVNVPYGDGDDHPAQMVTWFDAVRFCNWLSRMENRAVCYEPFEMDEKQVANRTVNAVEQRIEWTTDWRFVPSGTGYRLPTEAEWEFACRAGTTTLYSSGNDMDLLRRYAVIHLATSNTVGSKLPNGNGLFDMHGNVYEWCNDYWEVRYNLSDVKNPMGPSTGISRVRRGFDASSASHAGFKPIHVLVTLGFRVALNSPLPSPEAE